jgi:hypothetical protein
MSSGLNERWGFSPKPFFRATAKNPKNVRLGFIRMRSFDPSGKGTIKALEKILYLR